MGGVSLAEVVLARTVQLTRTAVRNFMVEM